MKFNWGTGIFVFYSIFVLTLVFIVYKSAQYDNHLVVEDYYAKDLAYQKRYDKIENSGLLTEKLHVRYFSQSDQIQVEFPDDLGNEFKGELLLYRADNKTKDVLMAINTDADNDMMIDASELARGRWKVQIDWNINDTGYYDEAIVHLKTP